MVTQDYAKGFTVTLADGSTRTYNAGVCEVPDEVANTPYAQHHLRDVPAHLTEDLVPYYGTAGHEAYAFANRDLGPDDAVLGLPTTAELDGEEELPQPDGIGLSTRVPSGRRRAVTSD